MPRLVITGFPGRLQASIAAGVGLIPGRGAKTPYALLPRKKEKKKTQHKLGDQLFFIYSEAGTEESGSHYSILDLYLKKENFSDGTHH